MQTKLGEMLSMNDWCKKPNGDLCNKEIDQANLGQRGRILIQLFPFSAQHVFTITT